VSSLLICCVPHHQTRLLFSEVQHFRLLDEKRSSARVYARIGMEVHRSWRKQTREFKLKKEGGAWRMQMNDILQLAGVKVSERREYISRVFDDL
jgi:hypothetical protein